MVVDVSSSARKPFSPQPAPDGSQVSAPSPQQSTGRKRTLTFALLVLGLIAAWRWTPLASWVDAERLVATAREFAAEAWALPAAFGVFVGASLLLFPTTVLIVALALLFGPWVGFVCSMAASLAAGVIGYGAGHFWWGDPAQRPGAARTESLRRALARRGLLAVAAIRLVPVAPYTVVNMAAGSTRLGLGRFTLGTFLGMVPPTFALSWFASALVSAVRDPGVGMALTAAGSAVVLALLIILGRRWLAEEREKPDAE